MSRSVLSLITALTVLALAPPALADVKINEVESDGAADFVELFNTGPGAVDVSGWQLDDSADGNRLTLPNGTTIAAGEFLAVDTDPPVGLGSNDAARLFAAGDLANPVDSYAWTAHAPGTTYGRCPDGTGAFQITGAVTKGAANNCPPPLVTEAWPGGASVTAVDQTNVLGTDVSGLAHEGSGSALPGVLWAVDNGDSELLRLVFNGTEWVHDTTNGWAAGKGLRYPDGTGLPDAEGVTLTDAGAAGGVFVSSERDGGGASRPSILRYDVTPAATTLTATREWNLTADLPPVDGNSGIESVTWVPDSALTGAGFVDEATGAIYTPSTYPDHGAGLFFVGLEANGSVYAYALNLNTGAFTRVATFASGFPTFAALHWEQATQELWVGCDNNCDGRTGVFKVDTAAGPTQGRFRSVKYYERPTGMANLNNEGFTMAAAGECAASSKPVYWADDGATGGNALRAGTIPCLDPTPTATATATATATPTASPTPAPTCRVPKVKRLKLKQAKRRIRAAGCRLGKVTKPKRRRTRLRVAKQRPKAGRTVPRRTPVNLTLRRRKA